MRVVHAIADITRGKRFAVTIGAFDGVHLGHQSLFNQLRQQARQHEAATLAITFEPDPAEVVSARPHLYLTSLDDKLELLGQQGLDEVCVVHFDEAVANLSAQQFMDELLASTAVAELVVGHDFAMGHDRQGTHEVLAAYAQLHGFAFATAQAFLLDGKPVSATRIRHLLSRGQVEEAARLLGRPHAISGVVVSGDRRGRAIGFPTANLGLAIPWAMPADGVYVAHTYVAGERRPSVVNVGLRPTFDARQRTIESHILDFSGDVYGQAIRVAFLSHLREERKFSGIEAIREQIGRDAAAARDYFRRAETD